MSLTADTADAIIAVDAAVATFEAQFPEVIGFPAYRRMKEAIEGLQETACGEGMHFTDADEARRFRDVLDHKYVSPATAADSAGGCAFFYAGTHRCGKILKQHVV